MTVEPADRPPLLSVTGLTVDYNGPAGKRFQAVVDVSFDVGHGETLGLVGESGCGKSTVARAVMQMHRPSTGSVVLDGVDLTTLRGRQLYAARRRAQLIMQDPVSALNPLRTVASLVGEGLAIAGVRGVERERRVADAMEAVGLDPAIAGRRPRQLSGGQCQRVCLARALAVEPSLLICDEAVSALDVSVQAQVLNLLEDMKVRYGLSMLFIAHDLAVVKNISDRVAVMYLGTVCEIGPVDTIHAAPAHPYTAALLEAIPEPVPGSSQAGTELEGELPSPTNPPSGCRFRTRCPRATELCAAQVPRLEQRAPSHHVACHHPLDVAVDAPGRLVRTPPLTEGVPHV